MTLNIGKYKTQKIGQNLCNLQNVGTNDFLHKNQTHRA